MQQITHRLTGRAPLVMHNVQLANPLNEYTQEIKKLTGRRTKTLDDHALIADLEWRGGLYLTKDGKPGIPKGAIHRCLIEAARKSKFGKLFEQGVIPERVIIPITYDGPKDVESLANDGRFRLTKPLCVSKSNKNKVLRTRPFFDEWGCQATFEYDPTIVEHELFIDTAHLAGRLIGLLDDRYHGGGRFDVEEVV